MTRPHAKFPPSGADRWTQCAAWYSLAAGRSSISGYPAAEGTVAHQIMEYEVREMLQPGSGGNANALRTGMTVGCMGWDVRVLPEMWDAARQLVAYIRELCDLQSAKVWVERYVRIIEGWLEGTADVLVYDPRYRALSVIDFKFGHSPVEPESAQLELYALGALNDPELEREVDWVHQIVFQPRVQYMEPFKVLTRKKFDVLAQKNKYVEAVNAALGPSPAFKTGKWCRYCAGRSVCPEAQKSMLRIGELLDGNLDDMEPWELEWIYKHEKVVLQRFADVKEKLMELGSKGMLTDYKVVHGRTVLKWADEESASVALQNALGMQAFKAKTPTQVAALGHQGKMLVDQLAIRPPGKLTLAPINSSRPAVDMSEVFDGPGL